MLPRHAFDRGAAPGGPGALTGGREGVGRAFFFFDARCAGRGAPVAAGAGLHGGTAKAPRQEASRGRLARKAGGSGAWYPCEPEQGTGSGGGFERGMRGRPGTGSPGSPHARTVLCLARHSAGRLSRLPMIVISMICDTCVKRHAGERRERDFVVARVPASSRGRGGATISPRARPQMSYITNHARQINNRLPVPRCEKQTSQRVTTSPAPEHAPEERATATI